MVLADLGLISMLYITDYCWPQLIYRCPAVTVRAKQTVTQNQIRMIRHYL